MKNLKKKCESGEISKNSLRVMITNEQAELPVTPKLRGLIRRAVRAALDFEDFEKSAEVSVTIVSPAQIKALNAEHRQIDRETDVLSFPLLSEEDAGVGDYDDGAVVLGDIVLSLAQAQVQAEEYGHSLEREVAFLCVHSVLHLLGYDHENPEEETEMFTRQEAILTTMGLTRDKQERKGEV